MGPKLKCAECWWVGGDHAHNCLTGAKIEDENALEGAPAEEWDDPLEDDDDDDDDDE